MNILFPEYKNFYYAQFHHLGYFLLKSGWWENKEIWNKRNVYETGNGNQHLWGELKYDESLIFKVDENK